VHTDAGADRVEFEPQWLRALAFGSASALVAFGAVGLIAAILGIYHPYLVFPVGAIVWVGLLLLARPILAARGPVTRNAHIASALGVVFVVGMSAWNARHAAQHILINRDGGSYTNSARWIALHGNLQVPAAVGPFSHFPGLTFASFAMYPNGKGVLSFQFAHLLPALLAEAHNLGGDRLMFAATALIGGVALLAFFVAAGRLLRNPFVALAALVSFALILPEVSFSRDSYSEIPMEVLIFTALWILTDRESFLRPRVALVAGLILGMLQAARIDGLVALLGVGLLFAIIYLAATGRDRKTVAISAAACTAGVIPGVVLGFTDVTLRSHQYIHDLRGNVKQLAMLMVASIVFAIVVAVVVPPIARRVHRIPSAVGWVAAGVVLLAGFGAWIVRPRVQHVRGVASGLVAGLQQAVHATVDPRRNYNERTMQWMSWYLGRVMVAAAVVAAALLLRDLLRGRRLHTLAGVALLGPASAVYLWKPNISTDQIFVMRRFLFCAIPLLILLAFGLVAALLHHVPKSMPRVVPVVVALFIAFWGLWYPISVVKSVPNITEQRGDLLTLRNACQRLGNNAAVVVLQSPPSLLYEWAPEPLRGWCNVPVAIMLSDVPGRDAALAKLATQWKAAGRDLWVVADSPESIHAVLPAAKVQQTPLVTNPFLLQRTLLHRPGAYTPEQLSFSLAKVPPG
jgi:hypothetical protein